MSSASRVKRVKRVKHQYTAGVGKTRMASLVGQALFAGAAAADCGVLSLNLNEFRADSEREVSKV